MARHFSLQDISDLLDDDLYQQVLDRVGSDEAEEIDNIKDYLGANTAAGCYGNKFATKVIDPTTGEVIFSRGETISPSALKKLAEADIEKFAYNKPEPFEYKTVDGNSDDFEDQRSDYILSHFSGDIPEDDSDESWESFYAKGSPFSTYYDEMLKKYPNPFIKSDVNGDGDVDVAVVDTDDNGKVDTAIVAADSKSEAKEGIKEAVKKVKEDDEEVSKDDINVDSTGTASLADDNIGKNIMSSLLNHRY